MTESTPDSLAETISNVAEPQLGRTLGQLGMLQSVKADGQGVYVDVELPTPAYPGREQLSQAIEQAVRSVNGISPRPVTVHYTAKVRGKNTGGALGLSIANIIAVGSGKGGVGKSTIAASLAYGLHHFGARVGLMDADVYGPSIPHLLGVAGAKPAAFEQKTQSGESLTRIEPVMAGGVKAISMGFFIDPNQAVVWRGPLLHRAILQFLKDTDWGDLDYLIIDLPPGTGDVSLTLSQSVGLAGAVVVCTPQQVALLDAVKAITMYRQVKIPILGMVENMTGEIFGRGGARRRAAELGVPFLGEVPIEADIRIKGDEGKMSTLFAEGNPARPYLLSVCEQTALQVAKQLIDSPSMPTLEIL